MTKASGNPAIVETAPHVEGQAGTQATRENSLKPVKLITEYRDQGEKEGATIELMAFRLTPEAHKKVLDELRDNFKAHFTHIDADSIMAEMKGVGEAELFQLLRAGWVFNEVEE